MIMCMIHSISFRICTIESRLLYLIVFLMSYDCLYSVAPTQGALVWSAVVLMIHVFSDHTHLLF